MYRFYFIIFFVLITKISFTQSNYQEDKCGSNALKEAALYELYGDKWGYSYDSLLNDIAIWQLNDHIKIQSIGQSTQSREMYELAITNYDVSKSLKHRIYIHARTHPGEVQAFRVTNEIINYLISDAEIAEDLRDKCIFHIVPMYNPDGVELEYPRENANGIDIESNWDETIPETEVVNLRTRFQELMLEENPVEIALNMHSAVECNRFFWYHHENGTSVLYTNMEKNFIESVRSHFLEGMMPYDSHVSWKSGNPGVYPESWWWTNYEDQVMALTYEDMNCSDAGSYDKTAYALLLGIADYLGLDYNSVRDLAENNLNINAYPNPFKDMINVKWDNQKNINNAFITDIYGKTIRVFSSNETANNYITWDGINNFGNEVPNGIYILNIVSSTQSKSVKIMKQ